MAYVEVREFADLTSVIILCATQVSRAQDNRKWIGMNLAWMVDLLPMTLQMIEALPQVQANTKELIEKIRMLIRRSEDVIDASMKWESQIKMAAFYKKPIYGIEKRYLEKEITKIKAETIKVVELLRFLGDYLKRLCLYGMLRQLSPVTRRNRMPGWEFYTDIPFYLRQCIFYFVLFPENFEIPARRLTALWVAEGLVRSNQDKDESAEYVAECYLNELTEKKVVSVKRKPNGKVKSCQLSCDKRNELLDMAKEAKFFHYNAGLISRLIDHNGIHDNCFIHINGNSISPASLLSYQDVLSFLSFNTLEGSKPGEDIGNFLDKCISAGCFRWMRVLDLERVFRPKLPKALSKLTLLRYLGLRWTYLEYLPDFVNKLFNLQVLDVKHTYISILPKSLWRMQYLRHLYLSETFGTRFDGKPSDISLDELQTLWGASIDEDTCVTDGLDTLQNICKLGLSCRSGPSENSVMVKKLKAVDKWISSLRFLESLRLKSRDEDGKAADLHLSSLSKNENLSTVYLLGKLQQSVVSEFPLNLIDITLSGSELVEDPMISLGKLPKLLILRLLSQSVVHSRMLCQENSFPELKVLKIWKLTNLQKWEADEGSLPSLEELEIRSCERLENLPDRLQQISSLQKVRLKSMPVVFKEAIKENQSLWDKIEHVLTVD